MFYAAVHFWAPTFKWGISIANLADSSKPPEKVSYPQQIAVTATGVIWSRYSTVITPVLAFTMINCTGIYQLTRKIRIYIRRFFQHSVGKGIMVMKVDRAVIASGARYSGPTIHYVDEQYDTGSMLAQSQRAVPVLAKDTAEDLAARVLHGEHKLYVELCAALCEERITWREDGVTLIRSKDNLNDHH
ncbi:hypothetical protein SASPL_157283 [Salvia splendens]|uniref:Mitochondrial pyruvate carrier n=1 Tax=Salvia splendens TaxID=180675 RepID=A0A8X8VVC8_SALSN|nr:hypothetical protein SASPL_157283 [Salvia splendens]